MWSTLASWIRGEEFQEQNLNSSKNRTQIIVDSLTAEVFAEIRYKETLKENLLDNERKPAYSWLVNKNQPPKFCLSDLDKYQLDLACSKVSPSMCNKIISTFRERSVAEENVSNIAPLMRAVIEEALHNQKKKEEEIELKQEVDRKVTKFRRLSSSWVRLRESQNKVNPLMLTERQDSYEIPTLSKNIEDLPV